MPIGMVKVAKSISIALDDGQRLILSLKEAQALHRELGKILERTFDRGIDKSSKQYIPSIKEDKKRKILAHLNKRLSDSPRTLTSLLKGVSYSPNQLPLLRDLIESQQNVGTVAKGKRVLYFKK